MVPRPQTHLDIMFHWIKRKKNGCIEREREKERWLRMRFFRHRLMR